MMRALRRLYPPLPRSVQMLQLGGLLNAVGNGIVLPFMIIYLHDVRGMSYGVAGLIISTTAVTSIAFGLPTGTVIDRIGARRVLSVSLVLSALAFLALAFVERPWQAFLVAAVIGLGSASFWPAQSTLLAAHTPAASRTVAWSMQRIVMNLGIGVGALIGGAVARDHLPWTFQFLYLANTVSFLAYLVVLRLAVPEHRAKPHTGEAPSYRRLGRDRPFLALIAINVVFILAGISGFELLPAYAKRFSGIEGTVGILFFVNAAVIVAAQLPMVRALAGRRRMRALALLGLIWGVSWATVSLVGLSLTGLAALVVLALLLCGVAIGECVHGVVYGPLVADLAEPDLLGRYMALSALSWQLGFALGPGIGGFGLEHAPHAVWPVGGALAIVAGLAALRLERRLPPEARRSQPAPG